MHKAHRGVCSIVEYMRAMYEADTPVWLNEPSWCKSRFDVFDYDALRDFQGQYTVIPYADFKQFKEFMRDMHLTPKEIIAHIDRFYNWREHQIEYSL